MLGILGRSSDPCLRPLSPPDHHRFGKLGLRGLHGSSPREGHGGCDGDRTRGLRIDSPTLFH